MAGLAYRGGKDKGVKVQDKSHAALPPVPRPFRGVQSELHPDLSSKHCEDIRPRNMVLQHAICHITSLSGLIQCFEKELNCKSILAPHKQFKVLVPLFLYDFLIVFNEIFITPLLTHSTVILTYHLYGRLSKSLFLVNIPHLFFLETSFKILNLQETGVC